MERGDLTGVVLDGRYRVIGPVAEGAMGVVYRAERLKLGRIVAIKVLHDVLPDELSGRKRFEIEAMAMAKLEHPHCASVLDVGVYGNRPFVVMDFVSGQNLKELIASGPLPIARATEIVRQVLSGLAHAHEHGIVHRDIKPANVVLSHKTGIGDHVKILDFGLARVHNSGQNLTSGLAVGTPAYMAPEQVRGQRVDHRADLYACGVVLFELLTGHKPFHSKTDDPIEVCKMHLSDPIPRLDSRLAVDFGELEAVVAKALAKRAGKRHASAHDFADAIEAAVRRLGLPAARPARRSEPIAAVAPDAGAAPDRLYPSAVEVRTDDVMSAESASRPSATPHGAEPVSTFLGIVVPRAQGRASSPPVASPSGSVAAADAAVSSGGGARAAAGAAPAARRRWRWRLAAIVAALGLAVGVALAIAVTREAAAPGAADAAGSQHRADPGRDIAARASELVARGDKEAALELLNRSRRQLPTSAALAYAAGRIYFSKFYWTEGLKSLRDAIRIDPSYRRDPELIRTVLRGFLTTPGYNDDLAGFLHDDIGSAAQPLLEETARAHPSAAIRSRAASELRRYR